MHGHHAASWTESYCCQWGGRRVLSVRSHWLFEIPYHILYHLYRGIDYNERGDEVYNSAITEEVHDMQHRCIPLDTFRVLGLRTGWFKYDDRWTLLLIDVDEARLDAADDDAAGGVGCFQKAISSEPTLQAKSGVNITRF